jgi:hypothetical protein
MYQNFNIPYLNEAWRQAQYVPDNIHQPHVHQPSTYEKQEVASAVLGSW